SVRLNAVSRIRVAIISSGSCGAEAKVKVRVGPNPSNSLASSSVSCPFWPARYSKPCGRTNQKPIVPSATSSLRNKRVSCCTARLESTDAMEAILGFMTLAGIVVPVELVRRFAPRQLVRAVAERLVLRQAAPAQPHFLAVERVLSGFLRGAFDQSCHG